MVRGMIPHAPDGIHKVLRSERAPPDRFRLRCEFAQHMLKRTQAMNRPAQAGFPFTANRLPACCCR